MLESLIVAGALLLDRLTKLWASGTLKVLGSKQLLPGVIEFNYIENKGAAFSFFWGKTWILISITVLILSFLLGYLIKYRSTESIWMRIAIASIIGGALGNLIDRLLYGYVIDFLRPLFVQFAIFNVADIFITCGAILFVVIFLFFSKEKDHTHA